VPELSQLRVVQIINGTRAIREKIVKCRDFSALDFWGVSKIMVTPHNINDIPIYRVSKARATVIPNAVRCKSDADRK
jgi:hypothetical protein